jgi:SAM-dependent methyltransferase
MRDYMLRVLDDCDLPDKVLRVLDVGTGTGFAIKTLSERFGPSKAKFVGCDVSPDMLAQWRQAVTRAGFDPVLECQPMHAFRMPRRYRTIYICDSFGLGADGERDLETLRRCYDHLEDGGALLVSIDAEYASHDSWDPWLPDERRALPEPWPQDAQRSIAADGSEHVARFRRIAVDPLEQTFAREVRLEKWVSGSLVRAEQYLLRGTMYLKNEVELMLRMAGFSDISVRGDYTDVPATPDSEKLVLTAIRRS